MRGQMRSALQAAGVSKYHYPRAPRALGAPSPAFVAMVCAHADKVGEYATELRAWQCKSGKLWRMWKKLGEEAKVSMVRMGRRMMVAP